LEEQAMKARKWGWMAAATIAGGALFGACSPGPSEREKQLEQRVQELEQQKAATPDPNAGWPDAAPAPVARPEPAVVPAAEAPVRPAPPRATSGSRPAARPAPRPETTETAHGAPHSAPAPPAAAPVPPVPGREPVERIPDEEAARGDSDWPAEPAEPARETVEPVSETIVVPANTQLTLRLETAVTSHSSTPGDRVTARVERAVSDDGNIVLPGGTVLHGRVTEADGAGRVKGRARVAVSFDRIVVRGRSYPIEATIISAIADDSHSRDAKVIGGSAVAGAIIGALKGGKSGAAKGAVIGAGAGTGAVLVTKGREVEMTAGSRWTVRTRNALRL
jgi:type IV secretory pathway VirB10-like protein